MVIRKRIPRATRARERGATLFVVVLVVTLLTGVGLYTVHSAGLVAQAAGHGRQSLQTEQLSQLGALATMSKLVQVPALLVDAKAQARQPSAFQENCRSTQGVNTSGTSAPFCLELNSESTTDFTLANNVPLIATDAFGAADHDGNPLISGRFQTETTEVDKAGPVAGSSVGSASSGPRTVYYQAKITSIAQLLPTAGITKSVSSGVNNNACTQDVMQVTGQHMTRAHVVVGPIFE